MSCCGKSRERYEGMAAPLPAVERPAANTPGTRPAPRFTVEFEYTGETGLTVIGGITGKRYRFPGRGARVAVDVRDRRSVAAVPHLRAV